jgi:hypothetical protein
MNRGNRSSLILAAVAILGLAPNASAFDIDLRTNTGFVVWGARPQDNTGRAVAFGDLDGDGYRDIITGSIGVDGNGLTTPNSGAVDIVWGDTRVNLGSSKDLLTQGDIRIEGADTGDQVGVFVVAGDFDNDGLDDLAMGAALADGPGNIRAECGDVYVFYGRSRAAWAGINNVSQRDVIIYGADAGDNSGISLAVGDIDADGADDLLIGGSGMDGPANGRPGAGGLHVVYGGPRPEGGAIDLGAVTLIDGTDAGDLTGRSVASGDLDGDGFDEVIIGVPNAGGPANARSQGGEVAVLWGRTRAAMGQYLDLASGTDFLGYGKETGDGCGTWVKAAGYDGDGYEDLIVGAPLGDAQLNSRINSGEVYLLYGKPRASWGASYDFDLGIAGSGKAWMGEGAGDLLGSALTGGDMDGDGKDDLALGAPLADGIGNGRLSSGEVYVYFGALRGSLPDTATVGGAALTHLRILGADAGDRTGTIMDMGELDGEPDNRLELAMGGPNGDSNANARFDGGEVAIIYGFGQAVPAILADIEASADGGGGAAIRWSTSQQEGIRGFNLYRVSGGAFERVNESVIPVVSGDAASYSFVDADAHEFVTGYEIRQVDSRGHEAFLGYVAFTPAAAPVEFAIRRLGSPFSGGTSFSLSLPSRLAGKPYSVALYDNAGRLVRSLAQGTVAANSLDVGIAGANLRAGVYHVRAIAGDQAVTAKVVKL